MAPLAPLALITTPAPFGVSFHNQHIVLGICGGIAAYRSADLIRELYRRGAHRVSVLLTPGGAEFVQPLTFAALSREACQLSPYEVTPDGTPLHIAMAQQADALLVHPATADMLAKLAHGFADDVVTTTAISFTDKPVVIAPAMNTRMWDNPATQANRAQLERYPHVSLVPPTVGALACGETGAGHLAPQEIVLLALKRALTLAHCHANGLPTLVGQYVLVTAGGTTAPLDPVRYLTNHSSGKMGVALADMAYTLGATVTLITTNTVHLTGLSDRPYAVHTASTPDAMLKAVHAHFPHADWTIMAAAVSDYAPATVADQKIKKQGGDGSLTLTLAPTADIVATLAQTKAPHQKVIGFAAETEALEQHALAKLYRKGLDAIVANRVDLPDQGFQADTNAATLYVAARSVDATPTQARFDQQPKHLLAEGILQALLSQWQSAHDANPSTTGHFQTRQRCQT